MASRLTESGFVAKDQLSALQSHSIFATATERPLSPAEVETYLAVKQKIESLAFTKPAPALASAYSSPKRVTTGAFDL